MKNELLRISSDPEIWISTQTGFSILAFSIQFQPVVQTMAFTSGTCQSIRYEQTRTNTHNTVLYI